MLRRVLSWFVLAATVASLAAAGASIDVASDPSTLLAEARRDGDQARIDEILKTLSPGKPLAPRPAAPDPSQLTRGFAGPGEASRERWALDILVGDQIDVEGHVDVVSTASGQFFAVVESMEPGNGCINIFRSLDHGASWYKFYWICASPGQDITGPAIVVPERAEDYVYLVYRWQGWDYFDRTEIATGAYITTALSPSESNDSPAIVCDNVAYDAYWLYILADVSEFYRSMDYGASWANLGPVPGGPAQSLVVSGDLAYANEMIHVTQCRLPESGREEGERAQLEPFCTYVRGLSFGGQWDPFVELGDGVNPVVAAIHSGSSVMVVQEDPGQHDLLYAFSMNEGVSWTSGYCLECATDTESNRPAIAVGPSYGSFHVAYWSRDPLPPYASHIVHRKAQGSGPTYWSDPRKINDTGQAEELYAPPSVAVEASGDAGVIWSDARTPTHAAYFDRANRCLLVLPDGTGDFVHIQAALDWGQDGDVIELTDGTYRGTGNRDLDFHGKRITLRSRSRNPEGCVIDCEGSSVAEHRGFWFHSGETREAVVEGVTVRNGYAWDGGAIACTDVPSSPTIRDCILDYNHSTDDGGALHISHGSAPLLDTCIIRHNTAGDLGGGVHCSQGSPVFSECVIEHNSSDNDGGGVDIESSADVSFGSTRMTANTAADKGGAIIVRASEVYVYFCTIDRNEAGVGGGAFFGSGTTDVSFERCTMYGNAAPYGGGLYIQGTDAVVDVQTSIISFGESGGAIQCGAGGSVSVGCTDIYGNAGGNWGGCIVAGWGNLELDPLFCGAILGDYTLDDDSPCGPDYNPGCELVGAWSIGCESPIEVEPPTETPADIARVTVRPNPSRAGVAFEFGLTREKSVNLRLFDVAGRLIAVLAEGKRPIGRQVVRWDGLDGSGTRVAPGLYFVRMEVDGVPTTTDRLVLVN